jgi:hypothetical protein
MNELKPEDVMRELEEFASLTNCNNMRYLEGCGHFCKVLREPIDDMAGGRSPKCNEHCEHYSPPRDEELFRATLAILREKDAEIERLKSDFEKAQCSVELLGAELGKLGLALSQVEQIARAEAINEFAEKLKEAVKYIPWLDYPPVHNCIDEIEEKLKGETDGESDL